MADDEIPDWVQDLPPELQDLPPYTRDSAVRYLGPEQVLADLPDRGRADTDWAIVFGWALAVAMLVLLTVAYSWGRHIGQGEGHVKPDRIDVEFTPELSVSDMKNRCDGLEGELIFDPGERIYTCEGVST